MSLKIVKTVPPDGGWGWVIIFAYVLSNFIFIPIQQNFGFLFKDTFKTLNLTGAHVTSIISTNTALSCLVGLTTGPLIKYYKIRKVSFVGSVLFIVGILSTIFAKTYLHFLVSYGIINGIGLGMLRLTSNLSLNLYFLRLRHKVNGVTLGLRSIGSMVMPPLVVIFLATYGITSTLLYIGGLSLHLLCTSMLLQPVEWHSKQITVDDKCGTELVNPLLKKTKTTDEIHNPSFLKKMVNVFDLNLFKNKTFLIITFGMVFSIVADLNFSTLFAFILSDLNFANDQIAVFITTSYISNVIMRIISPFIGDFLKLSSRFMYLLSILMVISGRFAITYFAKPTTITVISIMWGAAKAVRTVYWGVIMADNIPPEKLASAESIQMVVNGVMILFGGSLLGFVRDVTGSYVYCVYVINAMSFITILLWSPEMIYRKLTKGRKNKL